jgi:hypothetical protein
MYYVSYAIGDLINKQGKNVLNRGRYLWTTFFNYTQ